MRISCLAPPEATGFHRAVSAPPPYARRTEKPCASRDAVVLFWTYEGGVPSPRRFAQPAVVAGDGARDPLLDSGGWKALSEYWMGVDMDPMPPENQVSAGIPEDGIPRQATVVCSRVINYARFVCDVPPVEVRTVVTAYVEAMAAIVRTFGGFVSRSTDGEIVAVYGGPMRDESHAHRAVAGAREMLVTIHELNARWGVEGLSQLDGIGLGVDTGALRFIRIDTGERARLDVVGAPMTGAIRLQELTHEMGHPLIMSSEVAKGQRVFALAEEGPGTSDGAEGDALEFVGEVLLHDQGRRRLYGVRAPSTPSRAVHTRSR